MFLTRPQVHTWKSKDPKALGWGLSGLSGELHLSLLSFLDGGLSSVFMEAIGEGAV